MTFIGSTPNPAPFDLSVQDALALADQTSSVFDLSRLLHHGDERVRAAVAAHPSLPVELAWLLVDDRSDKVRHQLALRHFPGIANVLVNDISALVQLAIYEDPNLDPDLRASLLERY